MKVQRIPMKCLFSSIRTVAARTFSPHLSQENAELDSHVVLFTFIFGIADSICEEQRKVPYLNVMGFDETHSSNCETSSSSKFGL